MELSQETVDALIAMQESGWGVGGKAVEEDSRIDVNYSITEESDA